MTFLTILCPSCSASPLGLIYHPILHFFAKVGALNPSNNRNRCFENLDSAGASSKYASKGLFIHGDFFSYSTIFQAIKDHCGHNHNEW